MADIFAKKNEYELDVFKFVTFLSYLYFRANKGKKKTCYVQARMCY